MYIYVCVCVPFSNLLLCICSLMVISFSINTTFFYLHVSLVLPSHVLNVKGFVFLVALGNYHKAHSNNKKIVVWILATWKHCCFFIVSIHVYIFHWNWTTCILDLPHSVYCWRQFNSDEFCVTRLWIHCQFSLSLVQIYLD